MIKIIKRHIKSLLSRRMDINTFELDLLIERVACVTRKTDKDKLNSLIRKLSPSIGEGQTLIRLGPEGDGGYLVPDDLAEIQACFSPGVNMVSGFENDCADLGMNVFLADKSVESPADTHKLFHFTKKYIGTLTNDNFMTLDDWVNSSLRESHSDILLQIDIEGAEYETFLSISNELMRRFRIIVAEFHNLDQLWNAPFFRVASRAFDKILQTHTCVHIHPNNCCGSIQKDGLHIPRIAEFTFLRNDRIQNAVPVNIFPHPLDRDNTNKSPLPLPECWYQKKLTT